MVEEAAEDSVGGQDLARAHRLVHALRHPEHAIPVARVNDQEENLGIREALRLRFELANYLEKLVGAEELLFFVLLPESATPHINPAQVDESALISLPFLYKGRISVIARQFLHLLSFLVAPSRIFRIISGRLKPLKFVH